jgi:hypothetical protein
MGGLQLMDEMTERLANEDQKSQGMNSHYCSMNCRFFSDCPKKGGFCLLMELRGLQQGQAMAISEDLERTGNWSDTGGKGRTEAAEGRNNIETVFWCFPEGKGALQPWRRKLWEYQNKR